MTFIINHAPCVATLAGRPAPRTRQSVFYVPISIRVKGKEQRVRAGSQSRPGWDIYISFTYTAPRLEQLPSWLCNVYQHYCPDLHIVHSLVTSVLKKHVI